MHFPSPTVSSQITSLSLTCIVLFTLYRTDFKGVKRFWCFSQFIMLLPLVSAPSLPLVCRLCLSARVQGHAPGCYFYCIFILFCQPTFLQRACCHFYIDSGLDTYLFSYKGSGILGDLKGRVERSQLWEKLLRLYVKGLVWVPSELTASISSVLLALMAAKLCSNFEGNTCR